MESTNKNIHPIARIIFLIFSLIGIIIAKYPVYIIVYYCIVIVPLVLLLKLGTGHSRLLLFGIIPILLSFILIYIIILNGSNGGWDFIFLRCAKILSITSCFQIAFGIPSHLLLPTFKNWGLKGNLLQTILGAFTVWADIRSRANQIIIARFARGFIGERNIINTARQFPFVLIPMIIGVLRTSNDRVEVWAQRNVPGLIENIESSRVKYSVIINVLVIGSSLLLVGIGIYGIIR